MNRIKKKDKVIPLFTIEAKIKRGLRSHLRKLGFTKSAEGLLTPHSDSKETFRALHSSQREELIARQLKFIEKAWPKFKHYLADGTDIEPNKIRPSLELINGDCWQSALFRLASLTWSIPVSSGYGRRMRFLVWNKSNDKLMGIIALGDPVFNLKVRDQLVGWSADDRGKHLVHLMDAYVLGAVPPYNSLLCGKMVACLIRSQEVQDLFYTKYNTTKGIISKRKKRATLVMVTTSSAMGRSSIYNRLTLNNIKYFESVGFTSGWGHFHIPRSLFNLIREYLKSANNYAATYHFGEGPNWRLRAIKKSLSLLGLNPNLLRHGIRREVFVCLLADNANQFLSGKDKKAEYKSLLSVKEIAEIAVNRWVIPRATRNPLYKKWNKDQIYELIFGRQFISKDVSNTNKVISNGPC